MAKHIWRVTTKTGLVIVAVAIVSMFIFSLTGATTMNQNRINTDQVAPPLSVTPYGNGVVLWNTEGFQGLYNGTQVFWGTAWYYYLQYGTGETNPNYGWYIVGLTINRGSGPDSGYTGETYANMDIYNSWPLSEVWNVNAGPINRSPLSGQVNIEVGTAGAGISFTTDGNGYDNGTVSAGTGGNYGEFDWTHSWTIADNWYWSTEYGAYCAKTSASNAQATTSGQVDLQYYLWWPSGSTSSWFFAQYDSGATDYVTYPYSLG